MKNSLKVLSTLILALQLVGCSAGLQQDPLANKANPLKNGTPPLQKPELPEPKESDAVRIDAADMVTFMEDREDKIVLKMRVLESDYTPEIVIENMESFAGAKFDSATGEFVWKPALGTVFDGLERDMKLQVSGVAYPNKKEEESADSVILIAHKTVYLKVVKKLSVPEISKVENTPMFVREGETRPFKVYIKDPDAGLNEGEKPQLLIFPPTSTAKSIAHTLELVKAEFDVDEKIWALSLRLNMSREELTKSVSAAGARFQVLNRYGKLSPMVNFNTLIYTDLQRPDHTWRGNYELNPDVENIVQFFIFDPAREGEVTMKSKPTLPNGSTMTCIREDVGLASCDFKWTPTGTNNEQTVDLKIELQNKNLDSRDTQLKTYNYNLRLKVKRKVVVQPPAPAPVPPNPPERPAPPVVGEPSPAPEEPPGAGVDEEASVEQPVKVMSLD